MSAQPGETTKRLSVRPSGSRAAAVHLQAGSIFRHKRLADPRRSVLIPAMLHTLLYERT